MIETLYKTKDPQSSVGHGEFYELILDAGRVNSRIAYFVREKHGWWDEKGKRAVNVVNTLSPDEGYTTFEEAHERYTQQRLTRAKGGFVHSFSLNFFGKSPADYNYEYIPCDWT